MNKKAWAKLADNFETYDLLDALGSLDEARGYLNDQIDDDGGFRPPEMRIELHKLHGLAMEVIKNGDRSKAREMFDAAFELQDQAMSLLEHVEHVYDTLDKLVRYAPDDLDDEAKESPGEDADALD